MVSWWRRKMIPASRKLFLLTAFVAVTFLMWILRTSITYFQDHSQHAMIQASKPSDSMFVQRLVHIDLKGAPPKLSYLKNLTLELKKLGANGLLIEYEDMFPYNGNLTVLKAKNAYKASELEDFLLFCNNQNLSVIPLVQTFGHMEFVLKLKEFSHLREDHSNPRDICSRHNGTKMLIKEMLKQIIEFHIRLLNGNFDRIHIGGDEIYGTTFCSLCQKESKPALYVEHLDYVINQLHNNWPNMKIIIWDDVFPRMYQGISILASMGSSFIEPMIRLQDHRKFSTLHEYDQRFVNLWAAVSYRGDWPHYHIITQPNKVLNRLRHWLSIIDLLDLHGEKYHYRNIALVGWQRNDHFAALNELLPAAIPTLFLNLMMATNHSILGYDAEKSLHDGFHCLPMQRFSTYEISEYHPIFMNCEYFGHKTYKTMLLINKHIEEAREFLIYLQYHDSHLTLYHENHGLLLPSILADQLPLRSNHIQKLTSAAHMLREALADIYDEYTISEFVEQKIYSVLKPIEDVSRKYRMLKKQETWPQGPSEVPNYIRDLF